MNERKRIVIFNQCLDAIRAGKWSFSECEKKYPQIASDLRVALLMEESLGKQAAFMPSSGDIRRQKAGVLAKLPARSQAVTKSAYFRFLWQKTERKWAPMSWVIVITTILSLIGGAGTVYASDSALPGDALYPVKLWFEDVQLALASENRDAELGIFFLDRRMEEMVTLIENNRLDDLDILAEGYRNRTELLTNTIARLREKNPDEAVRFQFHLQEKLQEHARLIARLTDMKQEGQVAQIQAKVGGLFQHGIPAEMDAPDEGDGSVLDVTPGNQNTVFSNQPINILSGEIYEDGNLKYRGSFSGEMGEGVYAEISSKRFRCIITQQEFSCDLTGAPDTGSVSIFNQRGNLLFSTDYTYLRKGQTGEQGNPDQGQNYGGGKEDEIYSETNSGGKK